LASKPTTVLAATSSGRPALFVAANPRYCYWAEDIGALAVTILCESSPKPAAMLKLTYRVNPLSKDQPMRLDPQGCLKPGTYLYAFLQGLRSGGSGLVLFEGDRGIPVTRTWEITTAVKREVSELLSALESGHETEEQPAVDVPPDAATPVDKAALPGIRQSADVDRVLSMWRQCGDGWEPVAATIFDMAADALTQAAHERAAKLLLGLADGFVSGTSPARKPEFGLPSYPAQSFIVLATRLRLGEEGCLDRLAEYEKKFAAVPSEEVKAEYFAYAGWTLSLGGQDDLAKEKFDKAACLAAEANPASVACSSLVKVARVMKDCGRLEDAQRVLDSAADQPDRITEAGFSDRAGAIAPGTKRHRAVAAAWSQELKQRLGEARQSLSMEAPGTGVFLGYLLWERNKQDLVERLGRKDFAGAIGAVRAALDGKQESAFDLVLSLSACAAAMTSRTATQVSR
jgi:hypothetical protein